MISLFRQLASEMLDEAVRAMPTLARHWVERLAWTGPSRSNLALLIGLLGGLSFPIGYGQAASVQDRDGTPAADDSLEAHEERLSTIEQQVEVLERDLSAREQQRDRLYDELEQSEKDIAALARAGRQLDAMVAEQQRALSVLRGKIDQVRAELAEAREVLAELVRSAHAMGRGDRLRMILNQEDITRSGRLFGYYQALGQKRARQIAIVEQQLKRLQGLRQRAAAEAERLAELARRQEDTRRRLARAQEERAQIVTNIERSIAAGRDRMASLRENAARLRAITAELRRYSEIRDVFHLDQQSLAARRGQLPWPLDDTRVVSRFRPQATGDLHGDGVLLAADSGSEVHAVHNGQVVFADWLRGFGLLMVIDHHDGYMTIYGHNQSLLKEPGEWVGSGETIALAGSSGGDNRGGLYFALRHRGEPLDPSRWCRDRSP